MSEPNTIAATLVPFCRVMSVCEPLFYLALSETIFSFACPIFAPHFTPPASLTKDVETSRAHRVLSHAL